MRAEVRALRAGQVVSRLPAPEQLATLSRGEILDTLGRFGIRPDFEGYRQHMLRLASELGNRAGVMDAALRERLLQEIDRGFQRAATRAVKRLVDDVRTQGRLDAGASRAWDWVWVSVQDEETCESCDPRHGIEQSLGDWEREGKPGSAALVCQANCRCELVPIRPADEGESE